jgi:mRNA interferase YafQ
MRRISYSGQFKKDVKRLLKRGSKVEDLYKDMKKLESGQVLSPEFREHKLIGNYNRHLECHIGPDWLLIYRIEGEQLFFVRTGRHADLFD